MYNEYISGGMNPAINGTGFLWVSFPPDEEMVSARCHLKYDERSVSSSAENLVIRILFKIIYR